jgi:superkiller protein 3
MTLSISKGPIKKAIRECLKQVEKTPKDKGLHHKLGDLYLKDDEKEKAVDEYLKAGDLYVQEDLNARAIAIYKKVLSIDPEHLKALHRMGKLYFGEGLLGNAKNCYERILQISPSDREAIDALSFIEGSKQPKRDQTKMKREESIPTTSQVPPSLSKGIETFSRDKDLELHYHLGIGYKEMELFDYAVAEFEVASEDPSMKFDCFILLGECFKEKGDSEQSMKYLESASKITELRFEQKKI